MRKLIAVVACSAALLLMGGTAPAVETRDLQVALKLNCVLLATSIEPSPGYHVFDGGKRAYIEMQLTISNVYDTDVDTSIAGAYDRRVRTAETTTIIIPAQVEATTVPAGYVFKLVVDGVWTDGPTDGTLASATYDGACKDVPAPAKTVTPTATVSVAAAAVPATAKFTG